MSYLLKFCLLSLDSPPSNTQKMFSLVSHLFFLPCLSTSLPLSVSVPFTIYISSMSSSLFCLFFLLVCVFLYSHGPHLLWFYVISFFFHQFLLILHYLIYVSQFLSSSVFLSLRSRTECPGACVRPAFSVWCHPSHQDSPPISHGYLPCQRKQCCAPGQRR